MKRFLFFALFFCSCLNVFAIITFFSPDFTNNIKLQMFFVGDKAFEVEPENKKIKNAFSLDYCLEIPQSFVKVGARWSKKINDLTFQAVYWPQLWGAFNVGAGAIYHKREFYDIFTEQDLLFGFYSRYKRGAFSSTTDLNYMQKWTKIKDIDIPYLKNKSFAIKTVWGWCVLDEKLDFYFSVASYSQFSYKLFFCPQFLTGACYKIGKVSLGADFMFEYIDMALMSSYCDCVQLSFYIKWSSK